MTRGSLVILAVLGLVGVASAQTRAEPVKLRTGRADLFEHAEVLVDPSGKLSLDDVRRPDARFESTSRFQRTQGMTSDTFWLRVAVEAPAERACMRYLVVALPNDEVDVFTLAADGAMSHQRSGRLVPLQARPMPTLDLTFPIPLRAGQTEKIWVRIHGGDMIRLDLAIADAAALMSTTTGDLLLQGIAYGLLVAMCLYNFGLMVWLRDRAFLYYVIFQLGLTSLAASFDMLLLHFVWPHWPHWSSSFDSFSVMFAIFGASGFVRYFLHSASVEVPGRVWLKRLQIGAIAVGAFCPLTGTQPYTNIALCFVALSTAVILSVIVVALRRGSRNARFLAVAWMLMCISGCTVALNNIVGLEWRWFMANGVRTMAVVDAAILTYGLARRLASKRSENDSLLESMLHQRLDALSNLVSGVLHEVANPLNFVKSGTELLQCTLADHGSEKERAAIAIVARGAERIDLVLQNLRGDLGGLPTVLQPVSLSDAVQDTLAIFSSQLDAARVELQFSTAADVLVLSRPGEVGQIISNLVRNAIEAMPAGGRLNLHVSQEASFGQLVVQDSGPGVAGAVVDSLFDPFVTTRATPARGLGLYVAHQIARRLGGELRLNASVSGARFCLTLPIVHTAARSSSRLPGKARPTTLSQRSQLRRTAHAPWFRRMGWRDRSGPDSVSGIRRERLAWRT